MCYGMNCPYEGTSGTCGTFTKCPCHNEPEEIEETFSFYITTEIAKTLKHKVGEDSWDVIQEYIGSTEFWKDLNEKKPNFEFEES